MNDNMKIRMAKISDAEKLLEVYAPYVTNTAVTFEYEVPSISEFADRIARILQKYPYLAAECNGEIIGYAYASAFNPRIAYDRSCEVSIYINQTFHRAGTGRALYTSLEQLLAKQGILNANACIAYIDKEDDFLTHNSVKFHCASGFSLVGWFHKCGYKFNRWYDMVWMEKHIGSHTENPAPFIRISELSNQAIKECGIVS